MSPMTWIPTILRPISTSVPRGALLGLVVLLGMVAETASAES